MTSHTGIRSQLFELEHHYDVTILHAVESGSRAWGVASADSDFDPRFIYVHPLSNYLQLFDNSDTIEGTAGSFDYQGWDIRKALQLAYKSNPSLLEWLQSPLVYISRRGFADELRNIMQNYSPKSLMHHYVSLADRQWKAYLAHDGDVLLKKYLYAVRPIMAVEYMEKFDYAVPPIPIADLELAVDLPRDVKTEFTELLRMKRNGTESETRGRFRALDRYVYNGIVEGQQKANAAPTNEPDQLALEALFQNMVIGNS